MGNKKNPDNSVAELIDPDQPILLSDMRWALDLVAAARAGVMSKLTHESARMTGVEKQKSWKAYSDKWKESFETGITNLITYLKAERDQGGQPTTRGTDAFLDLVELGVREHIV